MTARSRLYAFRRCVVWQLRDARAFLRERPRRWASVWDIARKVYVARERRRPDRA